MIDGMLRGYIEAALWSSTDDNGRPLDENYDRDDLTAETLASMREDCVNFWTIRAGTIAESGLDPEAVGFNFWLTRNRHGAGFWDLGLPGDAGRKLTDTAHMFGESTLWVRDLGIDPPGRLTF